MDSGKIRDLLDEKVLLYNTPGFIEDDPIQVPHRFSKKEDIEISGFLTATIAWGNRKAIIKNAIRMMELMGNTPYEFVMTHKDRQMKKLESFIHRTFNATDLITFVEALKYLYQEKQGLEGIFTRNQTSDSLQPAIHQLKKEFFGLPHLNRTEKHLPDPFRGSAAKRINMYLRWMVRNDHTGVDFGIWEGISPAILSCPLDLHSSRVARKLGLLHRRQNDAKAVSELDGQLRLLDPSDPVKYDFALYGMGVFERF